MRILEGIDSVCESEFRRPVATLGVFDGVHRGHVRVIEETKALAADFDGEAVVVTFANHPDQLLRGWAPELITSLSHRLKILERLGIDTAVVLPFDEDLRDLEAEVFARKLFFQGIGVSGLVLGPRSRFGRGGHGSAATLRALASSTPTAGPDPRLVEVREASSVEFLGEPISSTRVRNAIRAAELEVAESMLGRPVAMLGTVVPGIGRGRTIGFPTANLDLHQELCPPRGVYGVEALWNGHRHLGLLNIGIRPTFASGSVNVQGGADALPAHLQFVEVHLLEFEGDLYGKDLEVLVRCRLRDEKKFAGVEELIAQIRRDRERFLEKVQNCGFQNSLTSGTRNL